MKRTVALICLLSFNVLANDNVFEHNEYKYGECLWTAADGLLVCKNIDKICFIEMNALDSQGGRYNKFACKDIDGTTAN